MAVWTTPEQVLHGVFGYTEFKPLQREIIANVLQKKDSLVIMPTGGGKSLCYQIPALLFPGLTVVISPLIALMKDQVEQLQALGVPALFLNSSLSFDEYQANMGRVRSGEIKLLYVAPETLLTPRLFNLLASLPLDCLTIDEAHCISEWGHDFRPEYRQIAAVRERFPGAACLALTATATQRVRRDIQSTLRFKASDEFIASFDRPNLQIEVLPKTDPGRQTLDFLGGFRDQPGIIYCFSRRQVDELSAFLVKKGYAARPYHAGLEDQLRKQNQDLFIRDDVQIIVATIAFGMGINKPNVRFVIHYDLPKSLENYYQEIGRAGRDGLPSRCLLLYTYADVLKLRYFIDQKEGVEHDAALQHLEAMLQFAESGVCRRSPLLAYFGEKYPNDACNMCDNCLGSPDEQVDITIPAQKFLSCVRRTGERFGATHIAHVLTGVEDEKTRRYAHQNLSTFGIGKDLTRKQWLHIAQQLVQKGLLEQEPGIYRTLKLTPLAYETLKNKTAILGRLESEKQSRARTDPGEKLEYDQELFEILRASRKVLADHAHVPPYVIFSDRTLIEMATYYPQTTASLAKINGVGQIKLERYGKIFLEILCTYCTARGIPEKSPQNGTPAPVAKMLVSRPRYVEVGEAFNAGQSLEALMAQYQVQQVTILDHLAKYAQEGNPLRNGGDFLALSRLPVHVQQAALQAFEVQGSGYLKPVYEQLNGAVDYDELRLLRLHFLSTREPRS